MSEDNKPRLRYSADGSPMSTNDGLRNVLTGMGTDRDKRSASSFVYGSMQEIYELEAAYTENWIARQVIDAPVDDATREWRTFSIDEASEIRKAENRLNLQGVTQEAFKWGGLYGGAGVLMITDQPFDKPLDLNRIKKGSLKRLMVLDRMLITGQDHNVSDPTQSNYLQPNHYLVNGGGQQIHHSHFVRAPGAKLPMRLRMLNQGWDDSQLRRCMEDIKDAASAKAGVASLIQEANIDIITKEGLSDALSSGDMDTQVASRYQMFGLMKSMFRLGLLDSTETYERHAASFGGLGEILSTLMEWVSGAAEIPMTRLFGVQAKGMGDSGTGDMNNYYNAIRGKQESDYRQFLEAIDAVLIRSALGEMPDDCQFEWNPLSQPSSTELAQQQLAFAQSDDIRLAQGVVTRSQVALKLKESGTYAIDDLDIKAMQAEEALEADPFGSEPLQALDTAISNGYVSVRPSPESAQKIKAHLDAIGIDDAISPEEMHVTLMYSREGIPGAEAVPSADGKQFKATAKTEPHVIGNDPWRALVIDLESSDLKARHNEIKQGGAKHSYPDFRPHLSVKYSPTDDDLQKLKDAPLDLGEIEFSDEQWKPVK